MCTVDSKARPWQMAANDMSADSLSVRGVAPPLDERRRRFARYAVWLLGFTLLVVLFGAVVRITGSGAGCGKHWPTCQGEIVHLPKRVETLIELSHRLSTGLNALLVFALTFRATRIFDRKHPARRAFKFASAMMVVESLVGAALVLLALVGTDASMRRAIVMPLHLVATSGLCAALGLGVFYSLPPAEAPPAALSVRRGVWLAAAAVLVVSASGALTALGDTVYPVQSAPLAARLLHDQGSGAHFLERLRVIHPLLAIAGAVVVLSSSARILGDRVSEFARTLARAAICACLAQVGLGGLNIWLSAPGWMQVVHLLAANVVWLVLVLLAAELGQPRAVSLGVGRPRKLANLRAS
ncbi:MAG TPA: COX15/CtaA family protein [Polyangiaceae bacterium]|nr:COX15/CtaA family protein [Polyangiaceae bacterium]